jgi:hypothetical protein
MFGAPEQKPIRDNAIHRYHNFEALKKFSPYNSLSFLKISKQLSESKSYENLPNFLVIAVPVFGIGIPHISQVSDLDFLADFFLLDISPNRVYYWKLSAIIK